VSYFEMASLGWTETMDLALYQPGANKFFIQNRGDCQTPRKSPQVLQHNSRCKLACGLKIFPEKGITPRRNPRLIQFHEEPTFRPSAQLRT
jgi:hypothetical protein